VSAIIPDLICQNRCRQHFSDTVQQRHRAADSRRFVRRPRSGFACALSKEGELLQLLHLVCL